MRMTILAATAALIASTAPVSATPPELSRLMGEYIRACVLAGSRNVVPTMMQVINDLDGDGQPEFLLDANRACDAPSAICSGDEPQGCGITFWLSSADEPGWQGPGLAAGIVGDALVVRRRSADCGNAAADAECYLPVYRIGAAPAAAPAPKEEDEPRVSDAVLPSSAAPASSARPPQMPQAKRNPAPQPPGAPTDEALPPALQASTDEMIAICNDVGGGGSGVRNDPAYLQRADLNGDGITDYVQYVGGIECVGAYSFWGGSAGFPATVWLSGPGGHTEHQLGYSQDLPRILEDGSVRTFLHGQMCDPPRIGAEGCEKVTRFR